jgi:hypothetical protein
MRGLLVPRRNLVMAVRERITILGDTSLGFNVEASVGHKAINLTDDVQLVQAMFNFIILGPHGGTISGSMTGMRSRKEVPIISGKMDAVTLAAIKTFQRHWTHNLLRTDGLIHPAKYLGRDIKTTGTGLMMITLLHQLAQTVAVTNFDEEDYTELVFEMFRIFPRDRNLEGWTE